MLPTAQAGVTQRTATYLLAWPPTAHHGASVTQHTTCCHNTRDKAPEFAPFGLLVLRMPGRVVVLHNVRDQWYTGPHQSMKRGQQSMTGHQALLSHSDTGTRAYVPPTRRV